MPSSKLSVDVCYGLLGACGECALWQCRFRCERTKLRRDPEGLREELPMFVLCGVQVGCGGGGTTPYPAGDDGVPAQSVPEPPMVQPECGSPVCDCRIHSISIPGNVARWSVCASQLMGGFLHSAGEQGVPTSPCFRLHLLPRHVDRPPVPSMSKSHLWGLSWAMDKGLPGIAGRSVQVLSDSCAFRAVSQGIQWPFLQTMQPDRPTRALFVTSSKESLLSRSPKSTAASKRKCPAN